ncbi:MAG TPA: glycoside hydrolase family 9 protein, partial [Polyangia bacterium]|nr:glycoside hydrolase family 9 protein [Polyangia bacterium]
ADASIPFFGSDARADVRGGWYDASGDISKYLSHLSYANFMNPQQIPLVAWALAWVHDQAGPALAASGNAAAVQAEALWGADYLLRVLDPVGYFYINVFDHWSGDVGQRTICAFDGQYAGETANWQSALREGGGMSIAALARAAQWKVDGAFTSAQYLAGAEKAFAYLNTNGKLYADDGKENVIDDYTGLLAASELYATTQNASYLDAARARATSLVGRLSAEGYFIADGASRPFWHASDAGLPTVALARYLQVETDESHKATVRQAMQKHLDYLVGVTRAVANPFGYARQHTSAATAGFFIPHDNESGYWWQGENARLGSLAAAALMGADVLSASGTQYLDLLRFAGTQLDWILGSNPYDMCFLNGFGSQNPPPYCASKSQSGTLLGGISNGITGQATDGSGIQWTSGNSCGEDWRWVEQWLPHSAWYMVAITALAR